MILLFALSFFFVITHISGGITGLAVFDTLNETEFDVGTYNNTTFNSTGGITQLDNLQEFDSNQEINVYNMTDNFVLFHMNNDTSVGETSTHVYDYSDGNTNGTWQATGQSNGEAKLGDFSGSFDGDSDYIQFEDNALDSIEQNFTFSTWLYKDIDDVAMTIFSYGDSAGTNFYLYVHTQTTNSVRYLIRKSGAGDDCRMSSSTTIPLQEWTHFAITVNDTNASTFVNGVEEIMDKSGVSECTGVYSFQDITSSAELGSVGALRRSTNSHFFDGQIDEFALWNRTLTPAEIQDIYDRQSGQFFKSNGTYTSEIFDAGENSTWGNISFVNESSDTSSGIFLNLSVRSCDDSVCDTETFTEINTTNGIHVNESGISENQFFQAQFALSTENTSVTPQLYNFTITTVDLTIPNVTSLLPSAGTIVNATDSIEIAANVTDATAVSDVRANITYPNGTIEQVTLTNASTHDNKYNLSYTTPNLGGEYVILILGNDTSNNLNNTENTTFTADYNFSFVKNSTTTVNYAFVDGNFSNVSMNGTFMILNDTFENGSFTSQVFDSGASVSWRNISLVTSPFGELPSNQTIDVSTIPITNMTDNIFLYHLNNDTSVGEDDKIVNDYSGSGNNASWRNGGKSMAQAKLGAFSGDFSGGNEHIRGEDNALDSMGHNFSISAWVYLNKTGDTSTIFAYGDEVGNQYWLGFFTQTAERLKLTVRKSGAGDDCQASVGTENVLSINEWNHVGVMVNDSNVSFFINGLEKPNNLSSGSECTTPYSFPDIVDDAETFLVGGKRQDSLSDLWNGYIDEISLWNRSLSTDEFLDIYKRGLTKLNLTVRSCDDDVCAGESFTDIDDTSEQNLSLSLNQYFQYQFNFETENVSYSSELYNVTVGYGPESVAPNITNLIPSLNSVFNISNIIEIAANVTDNVGVTGVSANVTLPNGTLETYTLSNASTHDNKFNVSYTIPVLTGLYNITFVGNDSQNNINSTETSNFTGNDITTPTIVDFLPTANTGFNITQIIPIEANVTDDVNLSRVFANITFPNTTIEELELISDSSNRYNTTFTAPNLTGTYNITFIANDSSNNRNTSETTNFTIFDNVTDFDDDGIADDFDVIFGNLSHVNGSGFSSLNISVGGQRLNQNHAGRKRLLFTDGTSNLLNFSYNFSSGTFNLTKIRVIKNTNSIFINMSDQLQSGETKTVYLTDNGYSQICVKESEIESEDDISAECIGTNETKFTTCSSSGTTVGNITCTDEGDLLRLDNLSFTGIEGTVAAAESESSSSSSGSSGGGGGGGGTFNTPFIFSESIDFIEKNKPLEILVPKVETVQKVIVTVTENISQDWLKVEETFGAPEFQRSWYKLFKIDAGEIKKKLKKIEIFYNVEKSWLKQRNLNSIDIGLFVSSGDSWEELPVTFIGFDEQVFKYSSVSDSVNFFIIGEKGKKLPSPLEILPVEEVRVAVVEIEKNVVDNETEIIDTKPTAIYPWFKPLKVKLVGFASAIKKVYSTKLIPSFENYSLYWVMGLIIVIIIFILIIIMKIKRISKK